MDRLVAYFEETLGPELWSRMLGEMLKEARTWADELPEFAEALVELLSGRDATPPRRLEEPLRGLRRERAGVALFVLAGYAGDESGVPAKVAQVFRGMSMKFIKKLKVTNDATGKTTGSSAYFFAR